MRKIVTIILTDSALFGCAEYEDPASLSLLSQNTEPENLLL
jgi:hypothetical protein